MNIIGVINEWRKGCTVNNSGCSNKPEECSSCTRAAINAIEIIEMRRIRLEAVYLPVKQYKLSMASVEHAKEWLNQNGLTLHVVEPGKLWAIVELNDIEIGVLREKHIEGVLFDPNAPKVQHVFDLDEVIDYERIG